MNTEIEKEKIEWLAKMATIPPRFKGATFNNFEVTNEAQKEAKRRVVKIAEKFKEVLEGGVGGAIFYGRVGTGKTHMAVALIKSLVKRYFARCRYVNVFDLINDVRETWTRPDLHEKGVIDRYANYHLLVIDEVGVQYGTDSERQILFQVINKRSMDKLPTILISNLDEEGLIDCLGERIVDRIFEGGGGTISFNWDSYRRK